MDEEFLQYIWANSLFKSREYTTSRGEKIRILHVGRQNRDAGPDFSHAKIEVNGIIEVGSVEVHLRESDWMRHGHQLDAAYDNVILSVTEIADKNVYTHGGHLVRTIEIDYPEQIWVEYLFLKGAPVSPRCYRHLPSIDPSRLQMLLGAYGVKRLERKCEEIREALLRTRNDWEACFYQWVTRYWSGNVNADAFSYLAGNLSYKKILRSSDSLFSVEALLLGFSGLLQAEGEADEYLQQLRKEYDYLEAKFHLQSMQASRWKFMRIRPYVFPTVRLALLAALLYRSQFLFSALMEASSISEVEHLLDATASSYWDTHFQFNSPSSQRVKLVGKNIKQVIITNAIIPFLFLYGKERSEEHFCEKALRWLEELPPEENHITRQWKSHGISFQSASLTQSLLHVQKEYCDEHRCLHCNIGHEVFRIVTEKVL